MWFDVVVAVGLLLMATLGVLLGSESEQIADISAQREAVFWTLQVAQTLPLIWRRRQPTAVVLVAGSALTASSLLGFTGSAAGLGVLVALYSVAAYANRTDALISLGVSAVAIVVSIMSQFDGVETIITVAANYITFGTAWLLGDWVRSRRERLAELEATTLRLQRERIDSDARAARRERNRIARELHDVVAHSLSVMVIHAGAVRRDLETSTDPRAERVITIEDTGRATLAEMRHLLGRIRSDDDEAPLRPQPGLADLDALVVDFQKAGLRADLTVNQHTTDDLSPTIAMSVYRIVQESLTNSLKHAGDASVTVLVTVDTSGVDVAVTDNGRGAAANRTEPGHGLIGINERVALFGGTMNAGPRSGGGWQVKARLPLEEAP